MRRVLLALLLLAAPARADTGPHREGDYGGVTPGEAPHPDMAKPAKPKRPPPKGTLTWVGFEAKDGGAQVFFQSVAPFDITQRLEGGALVVHLNLPRLGHNTWRQVDTRFFDNPLSGIVARTVGASRGGKDHAAHGAGIEARITFKNPKDAREGTVRAATEPDGMYYVYLTFPEGSASKAAPSEPETAPDATPAPAPKKPK